MIPFNHPSQPDGAGYLTNLDDDALTEPVAAEMPNVVLWDPYTHQNSHTIDTTMQPAIFNEGESTSLSLQDFAGNSQTAGVVPGGNPATSNDFRGMDISLEQLLFADCNATIHNEQPMPTGLTAYSSGGTPEHHFIGLPPPPVYSEGGEASTVGSPQSQPSLEDPSSCALQEDKRQRNTAASARFRVKKKQRDMVREQSVKEVQDNITRLEANLTQLEIENKWLKDLATQKMERMMADEEGESTSGGERSGDWKHSGPKDGVGT